MRYVACFNTACDNELASYWDNEPNESILLCPLCSTAMSVSSLDELERQRAAKVAAAIAAEEKLSEEAAANPPAPDPDVLAALLAMPPDRVVTASDLLAILRPEPAADLTVEETKPDA